MNPLPELSPHLKQLRLSGILDSLEARKRQAIESKLAYTDFLALLIQDEVASSARARICFGRFISARPLARPLDRNALRRATRNRKKRGELKLGPMTYDRR